MDENEILKNEKPNNIFGIIITEAIVVAVILISVLSVKYLFKENYRELKDWYNLHICAETDTAEVMESANREAGDGIDEV